MSETEKADTTETVLAYTRAWLEKAVIGLNLCPFAKAVYVKNQIRFVVSDATTEDQLLNDLIRELQHLADADAAVTDTMLLIHPHVLQDFLDYNDFLDVADAALDELNLAGEIQVASFHPDYRFAETEADDITNFSNRSPYPTLHLLREDSVERAVAAFPEAEKIFDANMKTLHDLGHEGWAKLGVSILKNGDNKKPG